MSLHPTPVDTVPPDTAAVARAVFPQGNACLRLRDRLGPIFADEQFAGLFPNTGQPAECPWRLALATLLQFSESLSDRRAADAVRSRIDWKDFLVQHGRQRTDSTHVLGALRALNRLGCAVHLTETCEVGQPALIAHVETTTAPVADRAVLADVHAALKGKDPKIHCAQILTDDRNSTWHPVTPNLKKPIEDQNQFSGIPNRHESEIQAVGLTRLITWCD